ncbi:hypothetical protein [Cardinium endosymbiont of Tipula unca]
MVIGANVSVFANVGEKNSGIEKSNNILSIEAVNEVDCLDL